MQNHNYFLVLYRKNKEGIPIPVGQKSITNNDYKNLGEDMFTSFAVGTITWEITERRIFERESALCVDCYIVVDAIIKEEEKK